MAYLDHEAIRKAYPNAVIIDDGTGAFDKDGKSVTLDQANRRCTNHFNADAAVK